MIKVILYTVYIGGKTKDGTAIVNFANQVAGLADTWLKAYTLTNGTGRWEGQTEPTAILHVLDTVGNMELAVETFADAAKVQFDQECVLVLKHQVETEFR